MTGVSAMIGAPVFCTLKESRIKTSAMSALKDYVIHTLATERVTRVLVGTSFLTVLGRLKFVTMRLNQWISSSVSQRTSIPYRARAADAGVCSPSSLLLRRSLIPEYIKNIQTRHRKATRNECVPGVCATQLSRSFLRCTTVSPLTAPLSPPYLTIKRITNHEHVTQVNKWRTETEPAKSARDISRMFCGNFLSCKQRTLLSQLW